MGYFRNRDVARKELGLELFEGFSLTDPAADRVFMWDQSVGGFAWLQASNGLEISGTTIQATAAARTSALYWIIDGGGSTITTGTKGSIVIPFACTITQMTALADQTGSIVVDIWRDTFANAPPTDADSITASAPITLSGATKAQDGALTGWATAIAAGDVLAFNVDSVATIQRLTIALTVTRT